MNAFKDIHDDAFNAADELFPSPDQNDYQNDAFRHAYWNALIVKEYGAEWRKTTPPRPNSSPQSRPPGCPGPVQQ